MKKSSFDGSSILYKEEGNIYFESWTVMEVIKYRNLTIFADRLTFVPAFMPVRHPIFYGLLMLVLAVLKREYGRHVKNETRIALNHIDKFISSGLISFSRNEAFKAIKIKNSFAATGLVLVPSGPYHLIFNFEPWTPKPKT